MFNRMALAGFGAGGGIGARYWRLRVLATDTIDGNPANGTEFRMREIRWIRERNGQSFSNDPARGLSDFAFKNGTNIGMAYDSGVNTFPKICAASKIGTLCSFNTSTVNGILWFGYDFGVPQVFRKLQLCWEGFGTIDASLGTNFAVESSGNAVNWKQRGAFRIDEALSGNSNLGPNPAYNDPVPGSDPDAPFNYYYLEF